MYHAAAVTTGPTRGLYAHGSESVPGCPSAPPAEPRVCLPLISEILTSYFDVLILPARAFRTEKPLTQDAFHLVSLFLQKRCAYPELCENHNGPGALLLTPRLDAQTSLAKLFADIGTQEGGRSSMSSTCLHKSSTVSPIKDELADMPPRRRGEIRAREVMEHGEQEVRHAPAHRQPCRDGQSKLRHALRGCRCLPGARGSVASGR